MTNYNHLGRYFKENQKLTIPVVVMYAFLPIPSNQVFIIAGLTNLNLKLIAFSFLFGRVISYTFWVTVAYQVSERFEDVIVGHFSNAHTIFMEILSISIVVILGMIPWSKLLKR